MPEIIARASRTRLLVLDVDGVLTDGRLYFGGGGELCKVFHARDGHGIVRLREAGCRIAVVSGRSSPIVSVRMEELGVARVFQGVRDKEAVFDALLHELRLTADATCCVGDDLPDLGMLRRAGLAVAVADAHPELVAAAHWRTTARGGDGAVREVCDLLLAARTPADPTPS
ncbi:MAG: HAD hydrolase family protein [Gammaproteobacteria bacterium]|nr:HAD hydrolase family protein [Gammaproteobacteria bacterium]